MLKIEFGFGIALNAQGVPIREALQELGLRDVLEGALNLFDGCTLTSSEGNWRDPESGQFFKERGATLTILTDNNGRPLETKVRLLVDNIKRSLNQKAVYVTRYEVQSKLY